jgi:capsule biosynthesis phosphatase
MRLCFDVDGVICESTADGKGYADVLPLPGAIESLRELRSQGHYIILQTARHMRTCEGHEGKVVTMGAPILFDWLKKWNVPYDEVYFCKPHVEIFIDDKGYRHQNWSETMNFIKEFEKTHND